jgi:hypothetical protein
MEATGRTALVIDLLIPSKGGAQYFIDAGPFRRLGPNGDDFYRAKYKEYAHLEGLLAEID